MIRHFLEVWLLLLVMFTIGCVFGAYLYGLIADSAYATAQGLVADEIGDLMDRIKMRFGFAPAWRRQHLATVERPLPVDAYPVDDGEPQPAAAVTERPARHEEAVEIAREIQPPVAERIAPRPLIDEPKVTGGDPERVASAMQVGDDGVVPMRPAGLSAPRGGVPDNLTRIKGIGLRNEQLLNSLGIYHFGQIASWTPGEVRWIGQYLAFPERIERDDWVGQATVLASGADTGFEKSAERRRQRRRQQQRDILAEQLAAVAAASILPSTREAAPERIASTGETEEQTPPSAADEWAASQGGETGVSPATESEVPELPAADEPDDEA